MAQRILMACLLVGLTGAANATLIDRGGGMIYDDVLDITWLQDANLGGSMDGDDSVAWADSLIFGGFDDWRLASMDVNGDDLVVDCFIASEADCQDNEMGYMFYYSLMGSAGDNLSGTQGLFTNIQRIYWSGTEFAPNSGVAWTFEFDGGSNGIGAFGFFELGAWAVREGDVVAAVPEPGTLLLMGLGFAGLGMARRREAVRT